VSIKLPPLPPLGRFSQDFHRMRVMQDGAWCPYEDVKAIDDAREARERILLARIAELEADAARYRWLRDNAAYSLSLTKDDHKICYETAAERIERDAMNPACNPYDETRPEELEKMASLDSIWSVYVYPITPIGHNCYHGATLDAAIDAARGAKP